MREPDERPGTEPLEASGREGAEEAAREEPPRKKKRARTPTLNALPSDEPAAVPGEDPPEEPEGVEEDGENARAERQSIIQGQVMMIGDSAEDGSEDITAPPDGEEASPEPVELLEDVEEDGESPDPGPDIADTEEIDIRDLEPSDEEVDEEVHEEVHEEVDEDLIEPEEEEPADEEVHEEVDGDIIEDADEEPAEEDHEEVDEDLIEPEEEEPAEEPAEEDVEERDSIEEVDADAIDDEESGERTSILDIDDVDGEVSAAPPEVEMKPGPRSSPPPPPTQKKPESVPPPPPPAAGHEEDGGVAVDDDSTPFVMSIPEDDVSRDYQVAVEREALEAAAEEVLPPEFLPGKSDEKKPRGRPKRPRRKKQWFEEIFDEDYLQSLPSLSDFQRRREIDFVEKSLGLRPGAMVLDLACGHGFHAIGLAERGYQMVGLDLSVPMLAIAGEDAQEQDLKINFLHGDMRDLQFGSTFDAVYCIGSSFGYFDDETNLKVLQGVHRALKPGGVFLLEVENRDFVMRGQPNLLWFEGDGFICMEETGFDFITSRLSIARTLLLDEGGKRVFNYSMRAYSLHELGTALHNEGYSVFSIGGHRAASGAFLGEESPKLIILSKKRQEEG